MSADIVYTSTVFPNAVVGVAYEAAIGIKSFASAVTAASVSSGSLPPGLSINADHSRITGTPTKLGKFTFSLSTTDTAGAAVSGNYTITVTSEGKSAGLADTASAPIVTQLARQWPDNYS